ncbi:MAG TPA: hypothetical protein VGM82_08930 [Gemmatimonadaceae bacterium]|jgi:hypothetical protein
MKTLMFASALIGSMAFTPISLEPHPHIRQAITELQAARKELSTAAHDFGGHRAEALRAVDAAIVQLREAQKYDK